MPGEVARGTVNLEADRARVGLVKEGGCQGERGVGRGRGLTGGEERGRGWWSNGRGVGGVPGSSLVVAGERESKEEGRFGGRNIVGLEDIGGKEE